MKAPLKLVLIAAIIAGIVAVLMFQLASKSSQTSAESSLASSSPTLLESPEPTTAPAVEGPIDVPSGKIAMSVDLSGVAKVGGFLRPGSYITIFNTVTALAPGSNGLPIRETRVLLTKVQVIGIAGFTKVEEVDEFVGDSSTLLVTVAVTQNEAERLVHGIQTGGPLYAGLLSEDTNVVPSAGVNDETIFSGVN